MEVRTSATACNAALGCVAPSLRATVKDVCARFATRRERKSQSKTEERREWSNVRRTEREREKQRHDQRDGEEGDEESGAGSRAKERKRVRGTRTSVSPARVPSIAESTNSSLSIRPRAALNVSRAATLGQEMERDRWRSTSRAFSFALVYACVFYSLLLYAERVYM